MKNIHFFIRFFACLGKPLQRRTLVFLLLFGSLFVQAQIPHTQISRQYFSDFEIHQLYEEACLDVYTYYKLPPTVLQNDYPALKDELYSSTGKKITNAFKQVENNPGFYTKAKEGSTDFLRNKEIYTKTFKASVADAFKTNTSLHSYLSFKKSDRITYYKSHVIIKPDGVLLVREDIHIYNGDNGFYSVDAGDAIYLAGGENNEIRKGIYRSLPLLYTDENSLFKNTTFKVLDVKRNGQPEPFRTYLQENGAILQIGNADYDLPVGNHVYSISYETNFQLKYLKQFDELAWNVTGNSWGFRIDSAICTIEMPEAATLISKACYTGPQGSKAQDCYSDNLHTSGSNIIQFKSTRPLLPNEGFSVGVSWNKGIVSAPGNSELFWKLIMDNRTIFFFPMLALLLIAYNSFVWRRVGMDPKGDIVIPQFYPPEYLSPAAIGFVYQQKFDKRLTTATMVDLAVRNKILIDVAKEGLLFKSPVYHIKKSPKASIPSKYPDYSHTAMALIGNTIKRGKYNSTLYSLNMEIENDCKQKYMAGKKREGFFAINNKYLRPGNIAIILLLVYLLFNSFYRIGSSSPIHYAWLASGFLSCFIIQRFFYHIMPAYSVEGRAVLDHIEGFKMYLKAADEKRINAMNPPEKTLELFEHYMPFAIALNCENEWGEQFKSIIEKASIEKSSSTAGTLAFDNNHFISSGFSSSFTSGLSASISSASTPPSSSGSSDSGSSFSSGGGSSGGGGGGGGGGGW